MTKRRKRQRTQQKCRVSVLEELAENDALFSLILARLDAVDVHHLSSVCRAVRRQCRPLVWRQFVTNTLLLSSSQVAGHQTPVQHIPRHTALGSPPAIHMTRFGEEIDPPKPIATVLLQAAPDASAMAIWESFPGEFAFLSTWFRPTEAARRARFFWKSEEWHRRRRAFCALCHSDDTDRAVQACGQLRCLRLSGAQMGRCFIPFPFLPIQFWWLVEKRGFLKIANSASHVGVFVHCDSVIHEDAKRHVSSTFLHRHALLYCWDAELCHLLSHDNHRALIDVSFPEILRDGLFWIGGLWHQFVTYYEYAGRSVISNGP